MISRDMIPNAKSFPEHRGSMQYRCLGCHKTYGIDQLLYTCPQCGEVFLLEDMDFDNLTQIKPQAWRNLFDQRASVKIKALRGIFRFYELIAPVLEQEDIVYLGEGNTPLIESCQALSRHVGLKLSFKNDGQNPSASFKDRGMACAFSQLQALVRKNNWPEVLTICASTGDTSASAALYAAYLNGPIKSAVILPQGKITPQQLAQPLGSGATVIEVPGVFDDCMKIVEYLAENYRVALLNSKNAWRILGQESYAFETAQWFDWDLSGKALFVPIGNAGNITAIMGGMIKLHRLGIIDHLPRIFGVQSSHADPVYQYYQATPEQRVWKPVTVKPSVAQAAMIGNPVSFPRVRYFAEIYEKIAGKGSFCVVQVCEQAIIEGMLLANRHGHIACTQGGECLAGLMRAKELGLLSADETAVLDATAHMLKFIGFQEMYFNDSFPPEYEISPDRAIVNQPLAVLSAGEKEGMSQVDFIQTASSMIAEKLALHDK